jgi:hypothetical protein
MIENITTEEAMSEDRTVFKNALQCFLGIAAHNAQQLPALAKKHAGELGLAYDGEFEEQTDYPSIQFLRTQEDFNRVDWDHVRDQLASLGTIRSLFAVPKQMLLGIRGSDGDIYLRMTDIQIYRHYGVFQTIQKLNARG